jgi:hypothetical protein
MKDTPRKVTQRDKNNSSFRDWAILTASTDPVKFRWVNDRLGSYGITLAQGLFSDPVIAEDERLKAMDKLFDWLGGKDSRRPLSALHPWAEAKAIVRNSLLDAARLRKIEGLNEYSRLTKGLNIRKAMAWIDPYFARPHEGGDEDSSDDKDSADHEGHSRDDDLSQDEGSGWRFFAIKDQRSTRQVKLTWVQILRKLPGFQWWWDFHYWRD